MTTAVTTVDVAASARRADPVSTVCIGNDLVEFAGNDVVVPFNTAVEQCAAKGGVLSRIENESERAALQKFMVDFLNAAGSFVHAFVGVKGTSPDVNSFTFLDGTTEGLDFIHSGVGLSPWDNNQPDRTGESCVIVSPFGLMDDVSCTIQTQSFLCRFDNDSTCVTASPTQTPTEFISSSPTQSPTTASPTQNPTTLYPTLSPTKVITESPTIEVTESPTSVDGSEDGPSDDVLVIALVIALIMALVILLLGCCKVFRTRRAKKCAAKRAAAEEKTAKELMV